MLVLKLGILPFFFFGVVVAVIYYFSDKQGHDDFTSMPSVRNANLIVAGYGFAVAAIFVFIFLVGEEWQLRLIALESFLVGLGAAVAVIVKILIANYVPPAQQEVTPEPIASPALPPAPETEKRIEELLKQNRDA